MGDLHARQTKVFVYARRMTLCNLAQKDIISPCKIEEKIERCKYFKIKKIIII